MAQNLTYAHAKAFYLAAIIEKGDSNLIPDWAPPEIHDLKAAKSLTLDQIYNFVVCGMKDNELVTEKIAVGAKKSSEELLAAMARLFA